MPPAIFLPEPPHPRRTPRLQPGFLRRPSPCFPRLGEPEPSTVGRAITIEEPIV